MPNQLSSDEVIVGDIKTLTGGQVVKCVHGSVPRNTAGDTITLGTIPATATILDVALGYATPSNAGTTATVSIGYNGGTGAEILPATSVKTTAGQSLPAGVALGVQASGEVITATYAESGTASTAGGPFYVRVLFTSATS